MGSASVVIGEAVAISALESGPGRPSRGVRTSSPSLGRSIHEPLVQHRPHNNFTTATALTLAIRTADLRAIRDVFVANSLRIVLAKLEPNPQ